MKKFPYLIFLLPLLLATTCLKDRKPTEQYLSEEEKLPAITQQGLNTFGCLVNGKAWLPDNDGSANHELSPDYWHGILDIRAARFGTSRYGGRNALESISVSANNLFSNRSYTNPQNARISYYDNENSCDYDDSTNVVAMQIIISRCDTVKRIIAGTFNATLYVDSVCDTLHITKGRFDVKY